MVGTVSAARRERRGVSPGGRGWGRSGAIGGGRDRIGVSRGDPARSSRGKRGGGRGRAGVPRRCPREPRKCLLRPTRRDRSRAEGAAGTRRDAPSPGLLARYAARSRSGTPGRATAPPPCAPWRVRDCRARVGAMFGLLLLGGYFLRRKKKKSIIPSKVSIIEKKVYRTRRVLRERSFAGIPRASRFSFVAKAV